MSDGGGMVCGGRTCGPRRCASLTGKIVRTPCRDKPRRRDEFAAPRAARVGSRHPVRRRFGRGRRRRPPFRCVRRWSHRRRVGDPVCHRSRSGRRWRSHRRVTVASAGLAAATTRCDALHCRALHHLEYGGQERSIDPFELHSRSRDTGPQLPSAPRLRDGRGGSRTDDPRGRGAPHRGALLRVVDRQRPVALRAGRHDREHASAVAVGAASARSRVAGDLPAQGLLASPRRRRHHAGVPRAPAALRAIAIDGRDDRRERQADARHLASRVLVRAAASGHRRAARRRALGHQLAEEGARHSACARRRTSTSPFYARSAA